MQGSEKRIGCRRRFKIKNLFKVDPAIGTRRQNPIGVTSDNPSIRTGFPIIHQDPARLTQWISTTFLHILIKSIITTIKTNPFVSRQFLIEIISKLSFQCSIIFYLERIITGIRGISLVTGNGGKVCKQNIILAGNSLVVFSRMSELILIEHHCAGHPVDCALRKNFRLTATAVILSDLLRNNSIRNKSETENQ
ncbi:hypothetical protein SDC9_141776 [bioreactor metagenome]|uniref:Uncharacterized protein n=1 Tax=bioreactor metagenome TaxID=1076179 RepID=A0A645DZR4_9ZZZZ